MEDQMKVDVTVDVVKHSVLVEAICTKVGVGRDKNFFVLCLARNGHRREKDGQKGFSDVVHSSNNFEFYGKIGEMEAQNIGMMLEFCWNNVGNQICNIMIIKNMYVIKHKIVELCWNCIFDWFGLRPWFQENRYFCRQKEILCSTQLLIQRYFTCRNR